MTHKKAGYTSIDNYISTFPEDIQVILEEIQATIQAATPDAIEKISYQMPTFYQHGNLVHFAAYKNHIGLYPTPDGITAFEDEFSIYKSAKGTAQFPLDKPMPLGLIGEIVKFRVAENLKKAQEKSKKKQK